MTNATPTLVCACRSFAFSGWNERCRVGFEGFGYVGQMLVGVETGLMDPGVRDGDDFAGMGLAEEKVEGGADGGF
jgi:hypothetical protein